MTDDLVKGDNCFFAATAITDGELLQGVRYARLRRHHPVARHALPIGHGAVRRARATPCDKLREYSQIEFG